MLRAWNQRLCNLRVVAALNVSSVAFRSIFLRSNDAPKRCTSSDFQEVVCRCTCQIWINPKSELPFKMFHISNIFQPCCFLVSFCCWCILVYLVYYLNLSESSQFIHGLLPAPAVRPPLQLEHRPLPVSHNKISQITSPWRKSPRNHQSQRTAPLLPSGVTGPVNSTLDRRWKIHHIHGKSVKHSVYVAFQALLLLFCNLFQTGAWDLPVALLKNGPGNQAKRNGFTALPRFMSCHLTEPHLV